MSTNWIPTDKELPPENVSVMTKIDDGRFVRNETELIRCGDLWFFSDGSMYVYYTDSLETFKQMMEADHED